jgi:flavin reductase (DIM6/NTAB) family NADH-FMN oxidoreductase RutF
MAKRTCGPQLYILPMPTVLVGAVEEGKPNFNAIAYCGVAQSVPPMLSVSMDKRRYTHRGISENGCFSVNIPSVDLLGKTDYVGMVSGSEVDKSEVFGVFYGKLKNAPLIKECPINFECELVHTVDFGGKNDLFIGRIVETYTEEGCMDALGPDMLRVKPIAFSRPDHGYWSIGKLLGRAGEMSNY